MKSALRFIPFLILEDLSLYVPEATQLYLFFVRSVSPIVGRAQQIVYMEIKAETTVQVIQQVEARWA